MGALVFHSHKCRFGWNLESLMWEYVIRTHLELQFGTSIITPKTFHLIVVVSFVDSSIPCTHSAIIVTAPSTGQSQIVY